MFKWRSNNPIERVIQGKTVEFIRIPIGTFQKMRGLKKDISKAAAFFMTGNARMSKFTRTSVPFETTKGDLKQDSNGDTISTVDVSEEPISIALLEKKELARREAISAILDIMTSAEGLDLFAEIIVKSAHKEFTEADIPLIKAEMDPLTGIEFLIGALEASGGEYAQLGKSWFQNNTKLQEIVQAVKQK